VSNRFSFRRHWGAELSEGGGEARFRLWAPGVEAVSLAIEATGKSQALTRSGEGWFELETAAVAVDQGYSFLLPGGVRVSDPAARGQMHDVHGPSRLVDPQAYAWRTASWRGRPWEEAVIYELHAGTFTPAADFDGIRSKLDYLAGLGVTAIELMPVAQFAGRRGWGYDGVLFYAPHTAYGGPEALKRLVDAAHECGLMVLLDVVYNHFGPDGNYLHLYAPDFFHAERHTPWGAAIAYDRRPVRDFFIDNALYWLEEYRFDGLRFDAIDQIRDSSEPHILEELASRVRSAITDRHVHLTTEDDRNVTFLHDRTRGGEPRLYTAEWNDDFHHVAHVLSTPDRDGYYLDYAQEAAAKLAGALSEGYVYQGEPSAFRDGAVRGEPSAHLPPTAFINFLQNHDQIGNRAFGERLASLAETKAVEVLTAILLLSPQIPLLFMGEEWGETRPFCFFTDFHGELGDAVREGRRNEFRKWPAFQDPDNRARIPDPNAVATWEASQLDWSAHERSPHDGRLALTAALLYLREKEIVPRLAGIHGHAGRVLFADGSGLAVEWQLADGDKLATFANLSASRMLLPNEVTAAAAGGDARTLYATSEDANEQLGAGFLPGWSVVFQLKEAAAARAVT
jgi:malto-oligosyltrehalose trehalohydrolase